MNRIFFADGSEIYTTNAAGDRILAATAETDQWAEVITDALNYDPEAIDARHRQ